MTRDDIIRMAREAGATPYTNRNMPDRPFHTFSPEQLEAFAALVAAAEREVCAKVCMDAREPYFTSQMNAELVACAAAIRART